MMSRYSIPESPIPLWKQFSGEYNSWKSMRNRCVNPKNASWKYYGAKGITVCERWASFDAFLEDMGPKPSSRHSIDRLNRHGNYEPDNCCWATSGDQQRNTSKCTWLTHEGRTMLLIDWAKETGIGASTIKMRINKFGWTVADALTIPAVMGRNRWVKRDGKP